MYKNLKKGNLAIYRKKTFVIVLKEVKYDLVFNESLKDPDKEIFKTYTCLFPHGKDTVSGVYLNNIEKDIL